MPESKKRPRNNSGAQLAPTDSTNIDTAIDTDHEPDACDVIATDLTSDEHLPVAKGGVV
jgi:hypothetical protein